MDAMMLLDSVMWSWPGIMSIVLTVTAFLTLLVTKSATPKFLPPGPKGWPIIGCLLSLDPKKPLHIKLTQLSEEHGEIFSMYLGSRLVVVINSYDALQSTLVRHSTKFAGRPDLATFTETKGGEKRGVSLSDFTPAYKQHRKLLQHSIHSLLSNKEVFQSCIQAECDRMVDHLNGKIGQEFCPTDTLRVIVSSAFLRFTFGSRHEYNDPQLIGLVNVFEDWFEAAESSNPVDFLPALKYLPSKRLAIAQSLGETVDEFCKSMIEKAMRGEIETNNAMVATFLEQIQDSQTDLNARQCASILTDLLGAGFDTVAVTLAWAVIYLARDPSILAKMRQEMSTTIDHDALRCDDVDRLPYCHAVVLEVLRLSTVAPLGLPHRTLADVQIGDYVIPKDTTVLPNLWQINHDSDNFESANSLQPERFLECQNNNPDDVIVVSQRGDCTFSAGVRRCPGKRMASTEIFMFLLTLVRHFDIEMTSPPVDDEPMKGLTLKPKPYAIKLHPVKSD